MPMTLICSGSLAFDRLLSVPGLFGDSLSTVRLDSFNVCLLAEKVKRSFGGTAGNIAYNLTLLGEKPLVVASVGDDPDGHDYRRRLTEWGLSLEAVPAQGGQMTAGAIIATDSQGNMFNFFHPGAMAISTGFDPAALPGRPEDCLAIVSPGGIDEMRGLCRAYRAAGIKYIFDPGQQLPVFGAQELIDMLDGSYIFICNEFEFEAYQRVTGLTAEDMFKYTQIVIVTQGARGSELMVPGRGSQHIAPTPVREAVNATGAGDAFRSGLMKGLSQGERIIDACRLGSVVSSFCVEVEGTQEQSYTPAQVMARYASVFKETINLL